MDILEIIKPYETLKKYGLILPIDSVKQVQKINLDEMDYESDQQVESPAETSTKRNKMLVALDLTTQQQTVERFCSDNKVESNASLQRMFLEKLNTQIASTVESDKGQQSIHAKIDKLKGNQKESRTSQEEIRSLSFRDAVSGGNYIIAAENVLMEDDNVLPLKPIPNPKMEGGNIVVEANGANYRKGVEELKFTVIGRISLRRRAVSSNND